MPCQRPPEISSGSECSGIWAPLLAAAPTSDLWHRSAWNCQVKKHQNHSPNYIEIHKIYAKVFQKYWSRYWRRQELSSTEKTGLFGKAILSSSRRAFISCSMSWFPFSDREKFCQTGSINFFLALSTFALGKLMGWVFFFTAALFLTPFAALAARLKKNRRRRTRMAGPMLLVDHALATCLRASLAASTDALVSLTYKQSIISWSLRLPEVWWECLSTLITYTMYVIECNWFHLCLHLFIHVHTKAQNRITI